MTCFAVPGLGALPPFSCTTGPGAGSLPSDMSGYEALTLLDVSSNQLEGSMPTGGVLVATSLDKTCPRRRLGFCVWGVFVEGRRRGDAFFLHRPCVRLVPAHPLKHTPSMPPAGLSCACCVLQPSLPTCLSWMSA